MLTRAACCAAAAWVALRASAAFAGDLTADAPAWEQLAPASSPRIVPLAGACCQLGACTERTPDECAQLGGLYFGDGVSCDPNPCVPYGACCNDALGACVANVALPECYGRFVDYADCDAVWPPCGHAPGACCRGDGSCDFVTAEQCATGVLACRGDMNCDGVVNLADIDPFVLALSGASAFQTANPTCHWLNGDCDSDGGVDFGDIDAFAGLLGATCNPTAAPGTWLGPGSRCDVCPIGIPIPPDAVPELEPCGADTNGGCSGGPPAFEPLSIGSTVHGSLFVSASAVDADWYQFIISGAEPKWALWLVTPERAAEIALLQPDALDCAIPIAAALAPAGEPSALEAYLTPGVYYARIQPAYPGDAPCGDQSDYVASLAADNEPKCQASISAGPTCLCKDRTEFWNPHYYPGGGTLKWTVSAGGDRLEIVQPDNTPNGRARGKAISAAVGDATLRVTYTTPQGVMCHGERAITVVDCALSFRASGTWDADNAVAQQKRVGNPQLGAITPGSPEGANAWVKSMEIKGAITPCIAGLPCRYDFRREYRGRSGTIIPNVGFKAASDDSPDNWRGDDSHDNDEDLRLDAPPKCTIFVIDTPGFLVGADCQQAEAGHVLIQCINFREWLNVDIRQCTSHLEWYTSTRIRCNPTNLKWEANNDGQGNQINSGSIMCGTTEPAAPESAFNGEWALAARMIGSERSVDRLAADAILRAAIDAGSLSSADRETIVAELLPLAYREGLQVWSSPLLAIELLAALEADVAADAALDRLLEQFPRPIVRRREMAVTPAADALTRLGAKAAQAIAARAEWMTDEEWSMARVALLAMPSRGEMQAVISAARDVAEPASKARLDEALHAASER